MARKPTSPSALQARGRGNRAAAGASPSRAAGGPALRPDLPNSSSRAISVGDKLPSENEISERYGVSRPVVREALLRLRADGLVTAHQGLGTFVSHQPAPRLKTFSDVEHVSAYLRAQECGVALEGDAARASGPAPHRRAVAQDRGGAPGLRRIAGAGAHVGRGRSGVPRQHRRSQQPTSIWACWRAFTIPSAASCA